MVTIANVVTALDVVGGALLVVDRLEGGGVADPALLVLHSAAVLLVPGLVNVLALKRAFNTISTRQTSLMVRK